MQCKFIMTVFRMSERNSREFLAPGQEKRSYGYFVHSPLTTPAIVISTNIAIRMHKSIPTIEWIHPDNSGASLMNMEKLNRHSKWFPKAHFHASVLAYLQECKGKGSWGTSNFAFRKPDWTIWREPHPWGLSLLSWVRIGHMMWPSRSTLH